MTVLGLKYTECFNKEMTVMFEIETALFEYEKFYDLSTIIQLQIYRQYNKKVKKTIVSNKK